MRRVVSALAIVAAALAPAVAQDAESFGIDELRGGLLFHSIDNESPDNAFGMLETTRLEDLNVELLFTPWLDTQLGMLRPHVGATLNFGGRESQIYAGLSWTWRPFDGPVFIEGSLGGTVHNGQLDGSAIPPARDLGCSVLFRESASIGYDLTENASVMLTIDHSSHAGLCGELNRGLTNLGLRAAWRF